MLILSGVGCASGLQTQLTLHGNPRGPAQYQFREMHWRSAATGNGIEFIGFGFIPFHNSQISRDWNPRWPESGFVVFRLHAFPEADGTYDLMLLGPAMALGPGDDEVLTGTLRPASIESSGTMRSMTIRDVPMKSRNKPQTAFTLSGTIAGQATDSDSFERELRQFNWELNSRRDVAAPPPRPPNP